MFIQKALKQNIGEVILITVICKYFSAKKHNTLFNKYLKESKAH